MRNIDVRKLVLTSILMSIVIVLQLIASVIKIGTFQISLVLVPIALAAILVGPKASALLGFVFGVLVILTGDAAFFISYGEIATIIIVLLKGTIAGYISGIVYNLIKDKIKYSEVLAAFIVPIVNTTVFVIGTLLFLAPALEFAAGGSNYVTYLFTVMIGVNFIIELIIVIILAPTFKRICDIAIEKLK